MGKRTAVFVEQSPNRTLYYWEIDCQSTSHRELPPGRRGKRNDATQRRTGRDAETHASNRFFPKPQNAMPSGDPARDAEIQKIKRTILEHREADAKIKEYVSTFP